MKRLSVLALARASSQSTPHKPVDQEERVTAYMPLAKSIARLFYALPYEDRTQEAVLGLVIAAQKYDPERGAFGAFARVVITNRLRMMLRKWDRVDEPIDEEDVPDGRDVYESVISREYLRTRLLLLSREELRLLRLKRKGVSQVEMARALNVSQPTISRSLAHIRRVLWPAAQ